MTAFVPGPGIQLTSSRTFFSGTNVTRAPRRREAAPALAEISAIKLPFGLGGGGAKKPPADPSTAVTIGGKAVTAPKTDDATSTALDGGLPKFYNPSTSNYEFSANAKGQGATAFDCRRGRETNTLNDRVNEQGGFRNMDPYTDPLLWARPGWSSDEARVGVRTVLRNVLGNAHMMEEEIAELATSISCVTETADIKEFVRAVALSHAYRSRFFEGTSNTRFVECNFLHFYGRAPQNQAEVSKHIQIINEQGYNAEINSYIDSDEYDTLWGDSRIPAVNFRGGHPYNNDMNKLAVLNGAYGSSHRVSTRAFLSSGDASGFTYYSVYRGLPEAWRGENNARDEAGTLMEFPDDSFWNPLPFDLRDDEVAWVGKYGNWTRYWYKDSAIFMEVMKPKIGHSTEEVAEAAAILKYGSTMAKNYV